MTKCLFELNWAKAKQQMKQGTPSRDLFYDWFCTERGLTSRAKNLIPKVNFMFKTLGLDDTKFRVSFKNNCPVFGELYDSFIIDSMDDKVRIWVSPKLGFEAKEMYNKCELCVIVYTENEIVHKLEKMFDNWTTMKNSINNDDVKNEILKALNG